MATTAASQRVSGLARALVQQGLLSETDAENFQTQAKNAKQSYVEQVIQSKRLTPSQIANFAARTFGVPLLDLNAFDLEQIFEPIRDDLGLVDREFERQIQSQVELIPKIGQYIQTSGGKRIRPAVLLMSARLCGYLYPRDLEDESIWI